MARRTYPRTIPKEMFDQWKKCYRHGDMNLIIEASGFSKPTISRAVKFGNASNEKVIDSVNNFFELRLIQEKEMANDLKKAKKRNSNGK